MMSRKAVRLGACSVLLTMGVSRPPRDAQSAVGAGPLTVDADGYRADDRRADRRPVKVAPGVTVREIGWDDNVFDEPETRIAEG